mmetsp:Transcript_4777/g.6668  ORF Transcript_4777/g.6668 Transcript_4777/m.6668 type:complete len:356 (-) Transcript_4777:34-1101(-)
MNDQYYYTQVFQLADADRDGRISGQEGAPFLRKSQLSDATLMEIWNLADRQKQGFLSLEEFAIALKLVALAQQGILPSLERLSQVRAPPQLVGVVIQSPQPTGAPVISQDDLYKYDNLFLQADKNKDGLVDGEEAKIYFTKANIPTDKLAKIWGLCERDRDNCLSVSEFRLAIHLVYWSLKGNPIPEDLSPAVLQSSLAPSPVPEVQQHILRRASQSTVPLTTSSSYPTPQVSVTANATPQMTKPMVPTQFHNQLNQTLHTQMTAPAPVQTQPPQQKSIFDEKFEFPVTFDTTFPDPSKEPQRLQNYEVAHKHNYDQSPYVHHHTLPGATFEQRANFTSELSAAIATKSKKGSES